MKMLRTLSLITFFVLQGIFSLSCYGQKIFWVERSNNRIRVGDLTPTSILNITNLATGLNDPYDISIDQNKLLLFYTEQGGVALVRANSNGTSPVVIRDYGAFTGYTDIAYSENANGVFGAQYTDEGGTTFAPEDGSPDNSLTLGTQGNDDYIGVAVDDGSEIVYFINSTDDQIYSTDFSGATATSIVSTVAGLERIAVDEFSGKLYFTGNNGSNRIFTCNNDGTGLTQLADVGVGALTSIQVYPKFNKIYYAKDEVIYSMNLDGTGNTALLSLAGTGLTDIGIEFDFASPVFNSLLPADDATNVIASSNIGMTFNENVKISTTVGVSNETSIRVFQTVGNVLTQTIPRGSATISIVNNVVTISGITTSLLNTDYYILVGSKVFSDLSSNDFVGISLSTDWNFKTDLDQTQYYSLTSGIWEAATSWTHDPSHVGPAASDYPHSTGDGVHIGNGHTITMTSNVSSSGTFTVESGGTLDAAGLTIDFLGLITIDGTLSNGGDFNCAFACSIAAASPTSLVTLNKLTTGSGAFDLGTDLLLMGGLSLGTGTLNQNGFEICNANAAPPVSPIFSNKKSTGVTLSWTKISTDDAFIVARQVVPEFKPSIGSLYNANTILGSGDAVGTGNFVVYKGPGTSVDITGLLPNTDYEFDMYSYNTSIGGCYTISNYQFASLTSCPIIPAPSNPINASYCAGDTPPAINVNSPGSGRNINWFDAATGGNSAPGNTSGGDGRGGVFIPTAPSGTFYAETYDGTFQCVSDTRTAVTLTLNPIVTPGVATGTQSVCVGDDPTVISGGTATGGDGTYSYQWESSTVSNTGPYTDIPSATLASYDPPSGILVTTYFRLRVTSVTCASQVGNFISVTVNLPSDVTALSNTPGDAQISLSWTNPSSCFDDVLIIAKQGSPGSTPVGDGSLYTASAVFGNGTAIAPGEFVVYKGTGTSVTVTGLANSLSYSFKVFTRKGLVWSSGVLTSGAGIPTPPIITFNPANGATNVAVTTNLTISFDEPVRNTDNSAIDNSNINTLLTLKLTNAAGANVPFSASINATKDVISIDPTSNLTPSQIYYLSISSVEDSNNNGTIVSNITFTTQAAPAITSFTPATSCVGQSITISGTNFGTSSPTVTINGIAATVTANSNTSITIVSTGATTGLIKVINNDIALSALSATNAIVSSYPTAFSVTGGGSYCLGTSGVIIGLDNSQSGVEYEVYQAGLATGIKSTPGGGAFNFSGFLTAANTYTVKATSNGVCAKDMSGSAVVVVRDIPNGTASVNSLPSQICLSKTANVTVTGILNATNYAWTLPSGVDASPTSTTSTITVKASSGSGGLISVVGKNECGSSSPATANLVINPLPIVGIGAPPAIDQILNDVLSFTSTVDLPIDSYAWDFGDGGSSTDQNADHAFTSEGGYTVSLIAKAANGCEGNSSVNVNITQFPILAENSIKNVVTANEDGKNDRLIVSDIDRFPNNTISVLDRWGVEVFNQDAYNNDWDFRKGGNYLPAGSYICIVKLNDSGTVITRTITLIR